MKVLAFILEARRKQEIAKKKGMDLMESLAD